MCKTETTCEVCGENPVSSEALLHGHNWCEACSVNANCDHCSCTIEDADLRQWDSAKCEKCAASDERLDWLDTTCNAVEKLAAEHEWEHDGWQRASTGSRYTALTKECDACILGIDRECTCQTVKVRVSDHGTAYCREDYSIAKNPSGDDHTLEILANRLAR